MISSKETLQATTLQGCRYPHTLSCSPHKVSSHERLGLLVELSAFLHCAEALDLQFLPCLGSTENQDLCKAAPCNLAHGLLLHSTHGFHGGHRLHGFHGFGHS